MKERKKKPKPKKVSVLMPPHLYEALCLRADASLRSLSSEMVAIVQEACK